MLAIGDVINKTYRVDRLLGEGGMARVYLVSHVRLPKKFALKLIAARDGVPAGFMQRFRREAEVLAALNHHHIVSVIDWNETAEGQPYLVMEYLEGEDLAHFLSRTGVLQTSVALSIVYQIGLALQAAHDAGVVHRDLKPGNVFLCNGGAFPNFVKVLDFGIAKLLFEDGALKTSQQMLLGTPAYMSPEQAKGNAELVDGRSDQFSLAIILYEMLSGRRPFCMSAAEEPMMTLANIIFYEPPPLPIPQLGPALQRAMSKDPAARFASSREFLSTLGARRAHSALSSPLTLNSTQGELNANSLKRPKHLTAKVAGAIFALAALGSAELVRERGLMSIHTVPSHPAVGPAALPAAGPAAMAPAAVAPAVLPASSTPAASPLPEATAGPTKVTSLPAPTPVPSAPAAVVRRAAPAVSPGPAVFEVAMSGASDEQKKLIRQCCLSELKPLAGMPKSYRIVLKRAGSLHIFSAPDAVRQTDLGRCLHSAFPPGLGPESVTVQIRGSR